MKIKLILFYLMGFSYILVLGQNSIDDVIKKYNSGSIDYINANELNSKLNQDENLVLLDTRSSNEYNVSHLKNAIWVGYDKFDKDKIKHLDKNSEIVVYCSIGIRSEQIGEELKRMGFEHLQNLYGGIFDWINQDYPVYNKGQKTQNIHPYDKFWVKFLQRGHKVLE